MRVVFLASSGKSLGDLYERLRKRGGNPARGAAAPEGGEKAKAVCRKLVPLERRYEAELQLLNEQITAKEKAISEFDSRVRGMPERMAKLGLQARKLEEVEAYARKNVSEAKVKIEAETGRIREARAAIEEYLREVSARMAEQNERMRSVERELLRLRKLEQWMSVQESELEGTLEALSKERKDLVGRFASLKAATSPESLKAQLKEVESVGARYEREARDIRRAAEAVEGKVSDARESLSEPSGSGESGEPEARTPQKKVRPVSEEEEWRDFISDLEEISGSYIE